MRAAVFFAAATVVAGCATVAPPVADESGIDPHKAAQVFSKPSELDPRVVLNVGQFSCPAGKHRAVLTNRAGAWIGCWSVSERGIHIDWEDGDALDIPKSDIARHAQVES